MPSFRQNCADRLPILPRALGADTARSTALRPVLQLHIALRIPDAIAPLDVTAEVRAGRVTVSVDVAAPREGRAATRVNWLARQLRDAPGGLRVDAYAAGTRTSTSGLLRSVRENPTVLIGDPRRDLRTFRIAATSPIGTKRGTGRGGFIDSVLTAIDGFYETVVQQLRPWAPKAPQLPGGGRTAAEEAGIDIQPPEHDLLEEADSELVSAAPPPDGAPPAVVEHGVELVADLATVARCDGTVDDIDNGTPESTGPSHATAEPNGGPAGEMVSWDGAQQRLDSERVGIESHEQRESV